MKKVIVLFAMTVTTVSQGLAQECTAHGNRCDCGRAGECCCCCKCGDGGFDDYDGPRHHDRDRRHGVYTCDDFNVYYNGVKVDDASVHSFKDLGRDYAIDAFRVFYKGLRVDDAYPDSFKLLGGGYAKDTFRVFYEGRRVDDAYPDSFKPLTDGYAKDTFRMYYRGKKID